MGFKLANVRQSLRDRIVVNLPPHLEKERQERYAIAEKYDLSLSQVSIGIAAGLTPEQIAEKVRASKALGKSRFAIDIFLERGKYPSEEEEREVEEGNEEAREMARRSNAMQPSSRSGDNDKDEPFGD